MWNLKWLNDYDVKIRCKYSSYFQIFFSFFKFYAFHVCNWFVTTYTVWGEVGVSTFDMVLEKLDK